MEINIGTWNMHYWQQRFGSYPKSSEEKIQWGIKSGNILENIMKNIDFLLLQETNPFTISKYKLMPDINIYYHQHPIEAGSHTPPNYIKNDPRKTPDNIFIPDFPNGFYNILPYNFSNDQMPRQFIQIFHNVFVPGNTKSYINILSDFDSWGSAILANKKYELINMYFFRSIYVGSPCLMCYEFKLSEDKKITIINLYGKNEYISYDFKDDYGNDAYSYYSDSTIHRMLSDITPIIYKAEGNNILILGGDLNADINTKDGIKDKPIFDRIENFGFHNFTRNIKTYYNKDYSLQDDYIFIKGCFSPKQIFSPVINYDPNIKEISPHVFIKVNLKIDL
jgi:hypothetical protein